MGIRAGSMEYFVARLWCVQLLLLRWQAMVRLASACRTCWLVIGHTSQQALIQTNCWWPDYRMSTWPSHYWCRLLHCYLPTLYMMYEPHGAVCLSVCLPHVPVLTVVLFQSAVQGVQKEKKHLIFSSPHTVNRQRFFLPMISELMHTLRKCTVIHQTVHTLPCDDIVLT